MGPKSEQKSISTLKAENQLNASRLAFSWFSGVEVGVKKRRQDRPRQAKTGQERREERGERREERGEKREERGERREDRLCWKPFFSK